MEKENVWFIPAGMELETQPELLKRFLNLSKDELHARWETPHGKEILRQWRASGFRRDALENCVGTHYQHIDLRGAPLVQENLKKANLRSIDFFAADLSHAILESVNLTDSWLSEANIRGTRFDWATMDHVLLDNVEYDTHTSFLGVNLNAINFTLASLLQDMALQQQRITHLEQRTPMLALLLRVASDYGRSLSRWALWCLVVILCFGLVFGIVSGLLNTTSLSDGMYFSIVTFTTLGYGDIYPMSFTGKILAVIEVIIGYIMGGLLVAILVRKVIP